MTTIWYLEAVHDDPTTNQYLVQIIGEQNLEYLYSTKRCAGGKRRNLFRCPEGYANVQGAISAIPAFNLKIEVFKEEEGGGVITRFDLWKKSIRKTARQASFALMMKKRMR
ncbi:MAG TPA: hypothetical protein VMV38_01230 [Candidatus Paceibacterota bacterium]|nr:hypothetical protein [Candidatus Paceibacterota bacterium]